MKKTTRITIETERVLTLRCGSVGRMWCEQCAAETEFVGLDALSNTVPEAPSTLQQWLDEGTLHCFQSPQGPVRICMRSLLHMLGNDCERLLANGARAEDGK